MSVVNKMLQDLEARKDQPVNANADYHPPSHSASSRTWIIMVLLLVVGGIIIWQLQPSFLDTESAQTTIIPVAAPLAAAGTSSAPTEPSSNSSARPALVENITEQTQNALSGHRFNQAPEVQSSSSSQSGENAAQLPDEQALEVQLQPQAKTETPVDVTSQITAQDEYLTSVAEPIDAWPAKVEKASAEMKVKPSQAANSESDLRQQVQIALARGDDDSAIELLKKLLQVAPDNDAARKRLASMQFANGNQLQADHVLIEGMSRQPDNYDLRLMRARLYVQMKNPIKAHDLLAQYNLNAVQAPDYISYRASLAQKVERFAQARLDYLALTQSQPANAKWWLGLAVAEERLDHRQPALEAYQHAKELNQLSSEVSKFVEQRIQYLAGGK
ncbi:tetratricopeptide repeat protein [Aliiglaciecola sp. LCG003]|uniref:tetratricopeptide repeat protein n=1 Tax=Aliiglaciecola sp. LCG003 TaxID=3053655 RepID=UPI002572AD5C|nr:tetratricopeptide repeat protein [Aliiglaciecola sp. LCG003]WJG09705.1 tetratricopeptide repeat protein [Aliiglaciecola sp. LCG003]